MFESFLDKARAIQNRNYMKIIAFLGNPGNQYKRNRHNVGFIVGEYFCDTHLINPGQKKFHSFTGTGSVNHSEICVLFPQTYMNNSGQAVVEAVNFYKQKAADVIIVHDEIELPFGKLAVKFGGGHKGQNGLRSITQHLGTADFARLRFGVGRPENPNISVAEYVLGNFFPEEMTRIIDELLPLSSSLLEQEILINRDNS